MCRFLLAKSPTPQNMCNLLNDFAAMCQKSRTTEGDKQEDGWGVAWLDSHNTWQTKKSLLPIWLDKEKFIKIPRTKLLLAHARSASFPNQKGDISFNQPYTNKNACFVFNGLIKGVSLPYQLSGKIGAQKIWSLIKKNLKQNPKLSNSLLKTKAVIHQHSQHIKGLNIGISDGKNIAALCNYSSDPGYFTLHYHKSQQSQLICSQPLDGFNWSKMKQGKVIYL